jgi:carbon monoxide dehydrogenase subunit G
VLLTAVVAVFAVLAISAPARAEDERAAADTGTDTRVQVRVTSGRDGLEVEGRHLVSASRAAAWQVLTDYDAIARFVSSMQESRVTERTEDEVLVEQVALGRLMFFKRRMRVTLSVHEEPPGRIRFEDVRRTDFTTYRGEWRIEERGEGIEIVYRVNARPAFAVPATIARGMLQRSVRELLSQVADEIAHRDALAAR